MKIFWKRNGRRVASFLLALLICAGMIPYGTIETMAAPEERAVKEVRVLGKVETETEDGMMTGYAQATVDILDETKQEVGTGITADDGSFTVSCADWAIAENTIYYVKVSPKEGDETIYEVYDSAELTVTADNVANSEIVLASIEMTPISAPVLPVTYTVTVNGTADSAETDGGTVGVSDEKQDTTSDGANIPAGEKRIILAEANTGYEITEITVTKGSANTPWMPDDAADDDVWWKAYVQDEKFEYPLENVDDDYAFSVVFGQKKLEISYTISANGKLILNSAAADEQDKIVIEAPNGESGAKEVSYTEAPYMITAALTDDGYHLTSFVVDDKEQLKADEIANDLNSKEYTFTSGITGSHNIVVEAEPDQYAVKIEKAEIENEDGRGTGTITVDGTEPIDNKVMANYKENVTFRITPAEGSQISEITVDGRLIQPDDADITESLEAGIYSYEYTIQSVEKEAELKVKFASVRKNTVTFEELKQQYGILLKNQEQKEIIVNDENVCYADSATIAVENPDVALIRFGSNGQYNNEIILTDGYILDNLYLRKNGNFGEDRETEITVNPPIVFVKDAGIPEIIFADDEIVQASDGYEMFLSGQATEVTIKGKVKEENLLHVVCANREMTEDELRTPQQEEGVIDVLTDFIGAEQEFSVTRKLAEGKDTDIFYLYAVDKAGHCSDAGKMTVKRDGTEPEITGFKVEEESDKHLKKYEFGNFGNAALKFVITADDVTEDADGNSCPAAGIKEVRIYSEDNKDKFYTGVASKTQAGEFEVMVPVGNEEGFINYSTLLIETEDKVGNVSASYRISDIAAHPNISDKLMLEDNKPEIKITPASDENASVYVEKTDNGEKKWYSEFPTVEYHVSDKVSTENGSGLSARKVFLNNTVIQEYTKEDYTNNITDYNHIPQEEDGSLKLTEKTSPQEGQNILEVTFTDLAGNVGTKTEEVYLDTSVPKITGFSLKEKNSVLGKVINFLSFGNFANGTVEITVTAEDAIDKDGTDIPSAGLKEITLYLDAKPYDTEKVENGKAVFILPAEEILATEEKVYLNAQIGAVVADNVNNKSVEYKMTTENSGLENSNLMIETVKPEISLDIVGNIYENPEGEKYTNEDKEIKVAVSDAHSGLWDVTVAVNEEEAANSGNMSQREKAVKEWTDSVSTQGKAESTKEAGLYEICATATDNAGNVEKREVRIYKDETAPQIIRYEMQGAGTVESDGLPCTEEDYGYYFHEDTKVTIYATDGTNESDCGVKEIHYYTLDVDGTKSGTMTVPVDADGKASFIIKAEYKGQIYAKAYDYLGNTPENFVTPNSLIVETPEQHEKEEHIIYEKQAAPYRDNNGKDLYAGNVMVDLTVSDTFSGIRSVEWSVEAPQDTAANQQGILEIDNAGAFAAGSNAEGWNKSKTEKNLVTELKKTISVSNNSNDIKIRVIMTDRAGNVSEKEIEFSIDKTKPVISLAFDNESPDSENVQMYKESRIATITVTERNFAPEEIEVNIANKDGAVPGISNWATAVNASNPDETVSTATVTFSEDGDYTLEVSGRDSAGNAAETVREEEFTIDTTMPVITVTYDNENPVNGNYFAAERTATIQIEEHNFSSDRVEITGTATDGEAAIAFPGIGSWNESGDVHTATVVCGTDGLYRFDVEYTDMAGNEAEAYTGEEYYVDMTEPEIEITGVENLSANNGEVIPRIAMSDTNYDVNGVSIELVGANQGNVTPDGSYTSQGNGQIFTFSNFPKEQAYDDIYTINATLTDMAGNESTETVTFSVNRFGSVYVFDNSLKEIAGTYIQDEIDVKLTEINVDSLEHDKIRVVVDANGTPRDLIEGTDYTVQETGGNGSWYQYDYTIDKELFSNDGRYIVTLYSEDAAGNINENIAAAKEAEINFGVDKTAPVVVPIDLESNTQYPVDVKNATVAVNDNLVLDSVEIYIGEQKCDYEADGENYTFSIPTASEKQDVSIHAVDAAGNRTNYIINGVLVTTNLLIRWYNNKPVFVGSLVGVTVITGGGIGLGVALKSGRIKVKRKKK